MAEESVWNAQNVGTAGLGLQAVGSIWQVAGQLGGTWGGYYQTKFNSEMKRLGADALRRGARGRLDDAGAAIRQAGEVQRAGEEAAVNRYLQLGQDVGRIYAGAAAGNIEVTKSRTVRNVESAARLMAARDVSAINRSAAQAANRYVDEARSARLQYANDLAQAEMMDIQAKLDSRIARSNAQLGTWSAAGSMMSNLGRIAVSGASL